MPVFEVECPCQLAKYCQGCSGRLFALLGRLQAVGHVDDDIPLLLRHLQLFIAHRVLVSLVVEAHMYDLAFLDVKLHPPELSPLAQIVQGPL